jgi:hypothetical protein
MHLVLHPILAVGMNPVGASIVIIQGDTSMTNNIFRKNFMMASMLAVGLAVFPYSTFAAAGGAGNNHGSRNNESQHRVLDAVHYSQDAFLKLSPKELTYLSNYRIDGFYEAMGSHLVKMLLIDHSSTQALLQDMAKLDTKATRKARLKTELQRVSTLNIGGTGWINPYRQGVKAWLRYPKQGVRK